MKMILTLIGNLNPLQESGQIFQKKNKEKS